MPIIFKIALLLSSAAPAFPLSSRLPVVESSSEKFVRYPLDVAGTKVKAGQVEAVIDASPEDVYQKLKAYENYKEFLPFFTESNVVKVEPTHSLVDMKASILGGTMDIKVKVKAKAEASDATKTLHLTMLTGNVKKFEAHWTLYPISNNRTFLIFYLIVDPDIWFVPNSKISQYNVVNTGRTIRSLRQHLGLEPHGHPMTAPVKRE